ncbi:MAG TPA: STAS domain-containing protein [Vicinamibacterales bacterium]|nr:STAS domain-containing protein [Vicinamibacterales bacterium]
MNIQKRRNGDVTILDLQGKLTVGDGAELLRDTVTSIVFQGDRKILLNLAGVPYMDSGGLGELVRCSMATRKAEGAVKLLNVGGKTADLMAMTKLLNVFDTFDNEAAALASFTGSGTGSA